MIGEKLSLPGKLKARFGHPGLVNGTCYDGIEFTAPR